MICFIANPLFFAMSSSSFAVESLSFPAGGVNQPDTRGRRARELQRYQCSAENCGWTCCPACWRSMMAYS